MKSQKLTADETLAMIDAFAPLARCDSDDETTATAIDWHLQVHEIRDLGSIGSLAFGRHQVMTAAGAIIGHVAA